MVALCSSEEDKTRTVVVKWAYINRLERLCEVAGIPNQEGGWA